MFQYVQGNRKCGNDCNKQSWGLQRAMLSVMWSKKEKSSGLQEHLSFATATWVGKSYSLKKSNFGSLLRVGWHSNSCYLQILRNEYKMSF